MNPTVTAAAIGVGGTVVVAVAGFTAAIWNTRRTIAHARESRVWDRRADVYVETLASLQYRQLSGRDMTLTDLRDMQERELAKQQTLARIAEYKKPDLQGLEARLQAFASQPVLTAMQASNTAHRAALDAFNSWALFDTGAATGVHEAWEGALTADDAVVEVIRTELQGRGQPTRQLPPGRRA